jgi:hypothetical protein
MLILRLVAHSNSTSIMFTLFAALVLLMLNLSLQEIHIFLLSLKVYVDENAFDDANNRKTVEERIDFLCEFAERLLDEDTSRAVQSKSG